MSDIEHTALSEVASLNPREKLDLPPNEDVSFVPMSAVCAHTGTIADEELRPFQDVQTGFTPFLDSDVLVAKITPCFQNGKIAQANIAKRYGFGSTEFHVVRPNPDVLDSRFAFHFLRQPAIRIAGERRMTGSAGQRRVPKQFLARLKIPILPLHEQKRIAEVLDRAEALRAQRRAALALLDELTKSIFLDMFGDPVRNPKEWERSRFSDLLEAIDSGWSPKCLDRPVENAEWGVLKLGAVTWCEYDASENKALPDDLEPRPELEVKSGDLLFTRKNTYELVAACAYVRQTPPKLMLPDLVFRFRLKDTGVINPVFLQALLIHPHKRRNIQRLAGGSAGSMPNISKSRLGTVQIELPPIDLQRRYDQRVATIEGQKKLHKKALVELDELFGSLQYHAFRGEL